LQRNEAPCERGNYLPMNLVGERESHENSKVLHVKEKKKQGRVGHRSLLFRKKEKKRKKDFAFGRTMKGEIQKKTPNRQKADKIKPGKEEKS